MYLTEAHKARLAEKGSLNFSKNNLSGTILDIVLKKGFFVKVIHCHHKGKFNYDCQKYIGIQQSVSKYTCTIYMSADDKDYINTFSYNSFADSNVEEAISEVMMVALVNISANKSIIIKGLKENK